MADLWMLMPLADLKSTMAPATGTTVPAAPPAVPHIEVPAATGPAMTGIAPATTEGANQFIAGTTQPAATLPKEASPWYSNIIGMAPIVLMLVALYFFMMRGQKKEEKRRKVLLSEMKRGDKVQTIGGLIGRVVSIDGDEVVLKVDESANVKATYKKSAILNVIVANDEKSK